MNISKTFLLISCMLPTFAYCINNTQRTSMVQGSSTDTAITLVKSSHELDTIVKNHETVFVCVYDPSLIAPEMVMNLLHEVMSVVPLPMFFVCINAKDMPTIKVTHPFETSVSFITFQHGEKLQQQNIDLINS